MKVNEVIFPAISLLNIASNNFSSIGKPSIQSLSGVDFSDPKVEAILSGNTDGSSHDSQSNANQPLRPSIHHGNELRFHYRSHSHHQKSTSDQCPQPPVLSCTREAETTDSCCVVNPGGVLVFTQFWDLDVGQEDSWGIHGLWPDKCNGQFYENCDNSRAYSGNEISEALRRAGAQDTLSIMNEFWLSNDESPQSFWAHEWKTHGTCVSTLEPRCFANYQTADEVPYYFETIVNLFQKFDIYRALSNADILPSDSNRYSLMDMQKAVQDVTGYIPDFVCKDDAVTTVQFYLRAQGPLQDGKFTPSHPTRHSNCPRSGIKYPVKTVGQ